MGEELCGEPGGVCTSAVCQACNPPKKYHPEQHRLEAFHVICRDCDNRDVFFALDPDRPRLGLRAVCERCGTWEYIE